MLGKIIFLSAALLAFIGFGIVPCFAQTQLTEFDAVDTYVSRKMKELGIPGAALVIVQGDQIVHLKGFGVADASGRPVTPQTPFFTGSTGKSFTALAIMQLVEAGEIELDAPVRTYLPWFRVADPDASEIITVRQLLNQVSGLPRSIGQEQLANTDLGDSAIENNVRALANVVIAYILLIFLPMTFGANLRAMILFQPDVGWIAVIGGIFGLVWGFLRTSIVTYMMR